MRNWKLFYICLLTTIHNSPNPIINNRPSTYNLQRSATEHSSTYKSHSAGHNMLSTCQNRDNERSSNIILILICHYILSDLLESFIPLSYNKPSTYQLQRNATEHSSTCKSNSPSHKGPVSISCIEAITYGGALVSTLLLVSFAISHKRPSTYKLQGNAAEHYSTWNSHSDNPQED
jgi:cell division protein FtsL